MSIISDNAKALGHKVVAELIAANGGRTTVAEVVEKLQATDGQTNWDAEAVRFAITKRAFDSDTQGFGLFRGRNGGIKEIDMAARKAEDAKLQAKRDRAAHARSVRAAKLAAAKA